MAIFYVSTGMGDRLSVLLMSDGFALALVDRNPFSLVFPGICYYQKQIFDRIVHIFNSVIFGHDISRKILQTICEELLMEN